MPFIFLAFFLLALVTVIALWKIFTKAGKPGWAVIIPIYNIIMMLEIAGKPVWWVFFFFIPLVNIIVAFILVIEFARSFGKSAGFAIGIIFLPFIFYPILGFGSAKYIGVTNQAL